jgi:hypothetical protein
MQAGGLTPTERDVLEFERGWWLVAAGTTKQAAIRERLSMSPARFYAMLDRLADSPAAAHHDPLVVHRIRRRRTERRRSRIIGPAPRQTGPR